MIKLAIIWIITAIILASCQGHLKFGYALDYSVDFPPIEEIEEEVQE